MIPVILVYNVYIVLGIVVWSDIVYTVQCTLNTLYCIVYSVYCILYRVFMTHFFRYICIH